MIPAIICWLSAILIWFGARMYYAWAVSNQKLQYYLDHGTLYRPDVHQYQLSIEE